MSVFRIFSFIVSTAWCSFIHLYYNLFTQAPVMDIQIVFNILILQTMLQLNNIAIVIAGAFVV